MTDECHAGGTHPPERQAAPPSAAGFLEPYGVRVLLDPTDRLVDAQVLLKALLEEIARDCHDEGASVIGHLKCLMRAGDRRLRCNLTSLRSGATFRGHGTTATDLANGAELDLAVLVYGLPATVIDVLVERALQVLLDPLGVSWSRQAAPHVRQGGE